MQTRNDTHIVGIFEIPGDRRAALDLITGMTAPGNGATDVSITDITLTQWTNPYDIEEVKVTRGKEKYNKFTVSVDVMFTIEGGYAEAQDWIINRFMANEEETHMLLQVVRISGCPLPVSHKELAK